MKVLKLTALLFSMTFLLTGCMSMLGDTNTNAVSEIDVSKIRLHQLYEPDEGQLTAVITTSEGTITIALYPQYAPNTVANFKALVEEGYYNGKPIFLQPHISAIVSGAEDETGSTGKVAVGDENGIEAEITTELWHFSGAVSVIGREEGFINKKMLSDSRFFILGDIPATTEIADEMKNNNYPDKVIDAYKEKGGLPQYTGTYTVFGQVLSGMDVIEKIVASGRVEDSNLPQNGAVIEKIELSQYHSGDPVDIAFEEEPVSSEETSSAASDGSSES